MFPRILSRLVVAAVFCTACFAVAGRVAWPQGWALLAVFLILVVALTWRLAFTDPALLRERTQSAAKAESWDRLVMRLYAVLLLLLMLVAALDSGRFRWSVVPLWAQVIGWSLFAICAAVIWHVTVTNTYLSRYARIQKDRDTWSFATARTVSCAIRCTSASFCCSVVSRSCSLRGTRTGRAWSSWGCSCTARVGRIRCFGKDWPAIQNTHRTCDIGWFRGSGEACHCT